MQGDNVTASPLVHLLPRYASAPRAHHRVMTQTNHIPLATVCLQLLVEPHVVHIRVVDMVDHNHVGENLMARLVACGNELRIVAPSFAVTHGHILLVGRTAVGPQRAIARLVAYLHPFGRYTFRPERLQHGFRVRIHALRQVTDRIGIGPFVSVGIVPRQPLCRHILAMRVGKEVRVVEVNHQP